MKKKIFLDFGVDQLMYRAFLLTDKWFYSLDHPVNVCDILNNNGRCPLVKGQIVSFNTSYHINVPFRRSELAEFFTLPLRLFFWNDKISKIACFKIPIFVKHVRDEDFLSKIFG